MPRRGPVEFKLVAPSLEAARRPEEKAASSPSITAPPKPNLAEKLASRLAAFFLPIWLSITGGPELPHLGRVWGLLAAIMAIAIFTLSYAAEKPQSRMWFNMAIGAVPLLTGILFATLNKELANAVKERTGRAIAWVLWITLIGTSSADYVFQRLGQTGFFGGPEYGPVGFIFLGLLVSAASTALAGAGLAYSIKRAEKRLPRRLTVV